MIIYLYGPDSYRRQEKLKSIIEDYKKKHFAFALEKLDLENKEDWTRLKDFVKAQSLFASLKLGIIENYRELEKGEQKELLNLLKENLSAKEPILIILEDKSPTKDFKFLLEKPALSQDFEVFTSQKMSLFIQMEAKKRGLILDTESQELLTQIYSSNTWGLMTELDKLALLNEKKITKAVLEKHIDISLPVNVFNALIAMQNYNRPSLKLKILEELLEQSSDSAMIFNIWSSLAKAAEDKIKFADYDAAVKSGKLEYEEVLLSLCL